MNPVGSISGPIVDTEGKEPVQVSSIHSSLPELVAELQYSNVTSLGAL